MNIAIIGAGNVGGALATSSIRAGHKVTMSAKDPGHADAKAKETGARAVHSAVKAAEVARSIGFRPIDAGPLAMSRALEAMAILNIALQIQNGWPWQSGFKLIGPTPDKKPS